MSSPHPADGHDLIRRPRRNNLKNVSLELPKRRLTVFTGVSGSGKSSLVFGTIASESQRLINETYSAFSAGIHAVAGSARRRRPRGADDSNHRRPGTHGRELALDGRYGDRRERDVARAVQSYRQASHRLTERVLVQRAVGARGWTDRERRRQSRAGRLQRVRGNVPALRGHGQCHGHRSVAVVRRPQVAERRSVDDSRIQCGRLARPHLHRRRNRSRQADQEVHCQGAADLPVQRTNQGKAGRREHDA